LSLYECVLIARNDVTKQQVEGIVESIASQLETDGGAMIKREYWGLRSLAYRIKKNRKGHYMLLGLDAKPAFVNEMERQLRLNEDILRFMTLGVNEIEEGPSALLSRAAEERDRNFRRTEACRPVRQRPPAQLRGAGGISRSRHIEREPGRGPQTDLSCT